MSALVGQQKTLVKRLLTNASGLVSTSLSAGYAPNQLGRAGIGLFTREVSGSLTSDTARPRFVVGLWKPVAWSPLDVKVNSQTYSTVRARVGDQYDLRSVDVSVLNPTAPFCIPCRIDALAPTGASVGGVGMGCSSCVDLTDPNRLPHDNWSLSSGTRGGSTDYWWTPTAGTEEAVLTVPGINGPANPIACHLEFTTLWQPSITTGPVILERLEGGTWTELTRWPFAATGPVGEFRLVARLRSYFFEASLPTSTEPTSSFRFRVPAGASQPSFMLFDPIITCHFGSLP
jgi:hypothetical protein